MALKNVPTVDAVCVVRCEDCRFSTCADALANPMVYRCPLNRSLFEADHFCSFGKRMDADAPERGKDGQDVK